MTKEIGDSNWPPEAGNAGDLPHEMTPPPALEGRVVAALARRGLLESSRPRTGAFLLRAAAVVLLLAGAFIAGRWTGISDSKEQTTAAGGPETADLYALLLYETAGYEPASGAAQLSRYHEYSRWVAHARERQQFVTGEDLAVDMGRRIRPAEALAPRVENAVSPSAGAPLSGVFLIRARDFDHAVELASELPHLEHGGEVVVQRVVPTDQPPV